MATTKRPVGIRLTDEARYLLEEVSRRLGVTQTAVMEMAVRRMATAEGVPMRESEKPEMKETAKA